MAHTPCTVTWNYSQFIKCRIDSYLWRESVAHTVCDQKRLFVLGGVGCRGKLEHRTSATSPFWAINLSNLGSLRYTGSIIKIPSSRNRRR
jgi:hypothetical protein